MKLPVPFHLPLESLERIDEICSRFESGDRPEHRDIAALLKSVNDSERPVLLRELIALDAELRQERGESPNLAAYSQLAETVCPGLKQMDPGFLSGDLLGKAVTEARDTPDPVSKRYRFDAPVGQGGIGDVWRVFDHRTQRPLAIKLLRDEFRDNPQALDRFRREALLTGILQHPGIPPVYDQGQLDDGRDYFSMKLVEGQTLSQILASRVSGENDAPANDDESSVRQHGEAGLGQLLEIFERISQTLAYAHSRGFIHRDLKPQNVMVGRFGEAQVMDWGLAKSLVAEPTDDPSMHNSDESKEQSRNARESNMGTAPGAASKQGREAGVNELEGDTPLSSDLTRAGAIVGTPRYMSPEQARGEVQKMDARTDVFGLGTVLFQILTQQPLYDGSTPHEVLQKSASGDLEHAFQSLDDVAGHTELVNLCRRCLSPDRNQRPADAGVVAEATRMYLTGMERKLRQSELDRASAEVRSAEQIKRQRWIVGLTSAVASVAIVGAIAFAVQRNRALRAATAEQEARIDAQKESATVSDVNSYLLSLLSSPLPEKQGGDVTLREVIDSTLPELDGKFVGKPEVEGEIRHTLGETYRWLGDFDAAEQQLRAALSAYRRVEPSNPGAQLETMDRLAGVLRSRGEANDLPEANRLRTEVLRYRTDTLGPLHRDTLVAANNLGTVLLEQKDYESAITLYNGVVTKLEKHHLASSDELTMRFNLAEAHRRRGNHGTAETGFRAVIDRCKEPTDPTGTNAHVSLGEMYAELKRGKEAVDCFEAAFQGRQSYYGELHPYTLSAMRKLARALNATERYAPARELMTESLDRHISLYGESSGATFSVRKELAQSLLGLDRREEGIAFLEATHAMLRKERGAEHAYTVEALQQLDDARALP